jgi:GGDEF domain-containing protein
MWFLLPRIPLVPPDKQILLTSAPYLLIAVGMIFSFHFRRGRIFMVLTLIAFCYFLFSSRLTGMNGPDTPEAWLIYHAITVLLPFNLMICALMQEKGVLTKAGRMRLMFFGFQAFILWLTIRNNNPALWVLLTKKLVDWPMLDLLHMPQETLVLFLLAGSIALWRAFSRQSPIDGGMFGSIIAAFIFLNWLWAPHIPVALCATAALILVVAVIQDSYNMAFRDDLTKLPSRRALNELLPSLGSRYSIAMVDVDHFKNFNDEYGHDVGDQVLKMIASKLMDVTGRGRPFRYGGEEFTIIFPGKGIQDAASHLESLRKSIAGYQMGLRDYDRPKDDDRGKSRRSNKRSDQTVSVTISIGVAEADSRLQSPREVIKAADEALYKAKRRGRNQVCLARNGR